MEIRFPAATHRVRADLVAALASGGGAPATARTDIVPPPSAQEIANLLRGTRIGLLGPTEGLRGFLAPARERVEDLGGLVGFRSFRGDLLILHTTAGYSVTSELARAVGEFLESGRSVIWFAGAEASGGEPAFSRNVTLDLFWPFDLRPQAGLPDLEPADLLGWSGADQVPLPLESRWPAARLIWVSDAALKKIASPSPDPAAAWLLYDLFFRIRRPLEAAREPIVVRSRTASSLSLPSIDSASLAIFRPYAAIDVARPVLLFADKNTLAALKNGAPDWEGRLRSLLERGGRVIMIHTGREDLAFLNHLGVSPPRLKPLPSEAKARLQPSPLLWGFTDAEGRSLRPRAGGRLLGSVIVTPDGSTTLLHWIQVGKGRLLLSEFDPTMAEEGDLILSQLLRNL